MKSAFIILYHSKLYLYLFIGIFYFQTINSKLLNCYDDDLVEQSKKIVTNKNIENKNIETANIFANPKDVTLSLEEIVKLVVEENRDLKNAYLNRLSSLHDLRLTENVFESKFNIDGSSTYQFVEQNEFKSGINDSSLGQITTGASISKKLLSGADVSIGLENSYWDVNNVFGVLANDRWNQSFVTKIFQPLLKNGGFKFNKSTIKIGRALDKSNYFKFKDTYINTVTDAIIAYRQLLQTYENMQIALETLNRTIKQQEIVKKTISSGRSAKLDIVQIEAEVEQNKLELSQAKNNFYITQLELNKLLDVDKNYRILPIVELNVKKVDHNNYKAYALALNNRPDYNSALLNVEIAEQSLLRAKNNRQVELNLEGSFRKTFNDSLILSPQLLVEGEPNEEWQAGVTFRYTFNDKERQSRYYKSKYSLRTVNNDLSNVLQDIKTDIEIRIIDIDSKYQSYLIAKKSRELNKKKLDIEIHKMETGRSSVFQLISFENDLSDSQIDEINAAISYLNALTLYDKITGTTLEKWGIEFTKYSTEFKDRK